MHNPVVQTIMEAYQQQGYTTLRFNFRGVEGSQGSYGEGVGEQTDVLAAINFLEQNGFGPIELSGYSFGTWVNAHVTADHNPAMPMSMVSPPAAFMDFRAVQQLPGLTTAFTGSRDDIAPPETLRKLVELWNPNANLEIIAGADHFYLDQLDALTAALGQALSAVG